VSQVLKCSVLNVSFQLSKKSLDETEVERDFSIRRKIKAIYNKKESDFPSVEAFKNYEEMVEDIIFNSVNYIDEEATKQLIEKYKQENSKEIVINQFRRKEELKGESISIKEREEEISAANMKFQVRCKSISAERGAGALFSMVLTHILLLGVLLLQESLQSQRAQKAESKRQLNQIMLGVRMCCNIFLPSAQSLSVHLPAFSAIQRTST